MRRLFRHGALPSLSLRARILLAVALLAAIAVAAAAALIAGITLASLDIERAAAAHRRVELLGNLSGRVGDYALLALNAAGAPGLAGDQLTGARARVKGAFDALDRAMSEGVALAGDETAQTRLAARSISLARMRARFDVLDHDITGIDSAGGGAEPMRVALDSFATAFAPLLNQMIDEERIASLVARDDTAALRSSLVSAGALAAALVVLLSAFVWFGVARPMLARLATVAAATRAIGGGRFDTRVPAKGHDELTFLIATVNLLAARLARREAAVVADRARLTEIIAASTEDLRAANRRLEAIDSDRRRFFADVSHELRTPLTVILGECDVTLRHEHHEEGTYRRALATIRQRARGLRRRVEDLLRVARSESGQIELDLRDVDPQAIAAEAAADVAPLARAARVTIDLAGIVPVPPVKGDADWLRQVVGGLLDNALRHTPEGAVVRIATRLRDGAVEIVVSDEGGGIPAEALPHVFERFYRGRSDEGLGYGIGLALAKWVVEQHHGTIAIESPAGGGASGTGTAVTVSLPLQSPIEHAAADGTVPRE